MRPRCHWPSLGILALLPLLVAVAGADPIRLSADRQSIPVGQQVSLTWQTGGQRAFLSGVGAVDAAGSLTVAPVQTTTYSLVTEGPSAAVRTVTVQVSGARGDSEFPTDLDRFRFPLSDKHAAPLLVGFLDGVHHLLQDEMKFSLRESTTPSEHVLFLTHSAERAELLRKEDDRIAARRIAYLVEVEKRPMPGEVNISIKALIEYRRKREEKWRQENDAALYQDAEARLRERIAALP